MSSLTYTRRLTFGERAGLTQHPVSKKLFSLMEHKKSNLAIAADVTTSEELLDLAETVGSYICVFKTHIDILEDFSPLVTKRLKEIAERHHFIIFEDRKFADIGNTVVKQYEGGVYKIADWAEITNAHPLPGPGIVEGLLNVGLPKGNGLLLLAQLSSKGSLIDDAYTKATVELALKYPDFVMGFISQERLTDDPRFIHMTPGIQLNQGSDPLGQQYNTPSHVIGERQSDIGIVGRGILGHKDRKAAAAEYRDALWRFHTLDILPLRIRARA